MQQPLSALLYRVVYAPGIKAPTDPEVFLRRGKLVGNIDIDERNPGDRAQLIDLQTAELEQGAREASVRYGIRLKDFKGRLSLLVLAPDLVPLESVASPLGLSAELTAVGVQLAWDRVEARKDALYNIYRSATDEPQSEIPVNPVGTEDTAYLDRGVRFGGEQEYCVRVILQPGKPRREGARSPCVTLAIVDRFPPAKPVGLIAVQEGLAVRLFWNPNAEKDLGGYRVERRRGDEDWVQIGEGLQQQPTYLDDDVTLGFQYYYRVVAVDQAEPPNTSLVSETVPTEILAEPEP